METRKQHRLGFGLPWLWQLPDSHPFHKIGKVHDRMYAIGSGFEDRRFCDNWALAGSIAVSRHSADRALARAAYALYRAFGWMRWKTARLEPLHSLDSEARKLFAVAKFYNRIEKTIG